jgi:hypothetical protein
MCPTNRFVPPSDTPERRPLPALDTWSSGFSHGKSVVNVGVNYGSGEAMASYFFVLMNGREAVGGRQPTELANFAEVQDEAIAFGQSVLKHRFLIGIEDLAPWAVRVSNELGRVLAVVPLSRIKRMRSVGEWPVDDQPIRLAGAAVTATGLRAGAARARPSDRVY